MNTNPQKSESLESYFEQKIKNSIKKENADGYKLTPQDKLLLTYLTIISLIMFFS